MTLGGEVVSALLLYSSAPAQSLVGSRCSIGVAKRSYLLIPAEGTGSMAGSSEGVSITLSKMVSPP